MAKIIYVHASRVLAIAATLLALTLSLAYGQTKPSKSPTQKATPSPTTPSPTPATAETPNPAIPMLDVVVRADELSARLQAMVVSANADQRLASVDTELKAKAPAIAEKQRELSDLIAVSPTRFEVAESDEEWNAEKDRYRDLRAMLAEYGKALDSDLGFLEAQKEQWGATASTIPRNETTTLIHERIANAQTQISGAEEVLHAAQANLLALQDEISKQNQLVTEALAKIAQLRAQAQRSLLERDGSPIWRLFSEASAHRTADSLLPRSYHRNVIRTRSFLHSHPALLWVSIGIFVVTLFLSWVVRRARPRILQHEPELKTSLSLFDNPVSLSILTALTFVLLFVPSVPQLIRGVGLLLCLYPVITLYVRRIAPSFRPIILALMGFGLLRTLPEVLNFSPSLRRLIVSIWQVSFGAFMIWLVNKAHPKAEVLDAKTRFVLGMTRVLLLFLTVAFVANVFGYVSLSLILSSGSVLSAFAAIVLRTEMMVVSSLLTMVLMFGKESSLSLLHTYGDDVARWGRRIAAIILVYLWVYVSVTAFGIRRVVMDATFRLFYTPLKLGAAEITLWDVAIFVAVLVGGVVVAEITRLVLREDILNRLNLKHGVPYAISTITYYVMLLLVFVLALAAGGVELSRFTLLTGAFGVGIGFGLQNTINNFASGMILLFERPIRVGDFLEVGSVTGEVERIGMRASSLRTIEGAEVIVPNSYLVTSQVTNWTLTKQRRRVVVRILARWDADPELVLDLIGKVAGDLPDIMTAPKPDAIFLGMERGFPTFELRFWVSQVRRHQKAKSEAALRLNAAFKEAGIDFDIRQLFLKKQLEDVKDESPTPD